MLEGGHFEGGGLDGRVDLVFRIGVMYATAVSVCFLPFHLVMKSTGIDAVSTLASVMVPWRTCARMCAHRRIACFALPSVAVPR